MTYVGKILVFVIMFFALVFLGISTVVFSTATNWKEATAKEKQRVADLNKQVSTAKAEADARADELAKATATFKADQDKWEKDRTSIEEQNKARQAEITDQRKLLETALQNTKASVEEAEARKKETEQLRDTLAKVQQQSNEYKLRQTELNEKIRILERDLEVAKRNNSNLRDTVAKQAAYMRSQGLNVTPEQLSRADNPPDVDGEVAKVDSRNSRVEITIGSDDGLVRGNTLYVYRLKGPDAGYLGKIQLDIVDPDQATGHVVGRTIQGKKIREGDSVTTQIRPRS